MTDQQNQNLTQNIATAMQEVTERAQLLVHEEIELAKAEVTTKVTTLAKGAVVGIVAGIFAVFALVLLLEGLAWMAWYLIFPGTTYFWGFFLVAGILFLLGALAGFVAARAFRKGSPPTPQMAIDEAKLIRATVQSSEPERTV
jgi:hypothetical protein